MLYPFQKSNAAAVTMFIHDTRIQGYMAVAVGICPETYTAAYLRFGGHYALLNSIQERPPERNTFQAFLFALIPASHVAMTNGFYQVRDNLYQKVSG